ncbi:unnamed protein product (macronuclear) [Paramecium tetraurelia]|uniref:Uncharacterized protein n=1 Tax=Paramecium tetraurelia TaxID=5888 RepID=A0CK10_PARTE|nr:uncharacterized protein GSPATT00000839001 [Paramecium tetraurelia]CAK71127.1 unnamed protein product [Paramecium tetraurelia]|eukprot:XP_001438524.1 hypothetical protein (macronuclear) [Paramecium tetraurelia strain d4-2]
MEDQKARKIQKAWRSFTNRKIFQYYKDIILFKCKGNPARLLKAINPNEAQLLDAACKSHIRFRLGGEQFPPIIYYKIYSHGGIVDLNSFAPRDYSSIQRDPVPHEKVAYSEYKKNQQKYDNQGWYLRLDNNGWRPISNKQMIKADFVELYTANKIRYYHHKKDKREEKVNKKTRLNKLKWAQSIQKQKEGTQQNKQVQQSQDFFTQTKQYLEMDDDEFDKEVQNLIDWSENLDYDKYMTEWFQLSTSNASENYVVQQIHQTKIDSVFKGT